MDSIPENPFTKAAIEMALVDLAGKSLGEPLYKLLAPGKSTREIPIKFSIGLREPEDAASIAREKVRQGFRAIKVKVGPDPERDFARTAAVRNAIGPELQLTIDVNGGWSAEQAIQEIPRYNELGVEYVEQPTPRWNIEAMAEVRKRSSLPIMADESVFSPWQAAQVIARRAADIISIYPGKNGGILRAMDIAGQAAVAGVACHIGSNLEWDIGTAAMCHLACACSNVDAERYPVDILGPLYYEVRPQKPLSLEEGKVTVPVLPGLGVEIEKSEIENLSRESTRSAGNPGLLRGSRDPDRHQMQPGA
jgi:muconate cycloisomerase